MAHVHALVGGLPLPVQQRLEAQCEVVPLVRGQSLPTAGESRGHTYFVTAGLISILALTVDGATLELTSVASGGVVGLPTILRRSSTPHETVVQVSGEALRISTEALRLVLEDSVALREACTQYAGAVLSDIAQSTVCHHFHQLSERLCRWLLNASDRVHVETLSLTHENLARILGAPRTAVSAATSDLQEADAIHCRRGSIALVNRRRLEASACPCYAATRDAFVLTPPPKDRRSRTAWPGRG